MVKYMLAMVLALAGISSPASAQTQNPYFALSYNTSQGTASMRLAGDFGVVVDTQNLTNYMLRVLRYSGISISTSVTMTGTSSMTITGVMSASTVTASNLYSTGQTVVSGSMTVVGKVALGGNAAVAAPLSVKSTTADDYSLYLASANGTAMLYVNKNANLILNADTNNTEASTGGLYVNGPGVFYKGMTVTYGVSAATFTVTNGAVVNTPATHTIADSGADSDPATFTVDDSSGVVHLTCSDNDGCTITMGESNALAGQSQIIMNLGAYAATFADQAGVLYLAGGAASLATYYSLHLHYTGALWVEVGIK